MVGKMRKKRILYIQHVDWKWIKQRPHFLAENLSLYNKLVLCYVIQLDRKSLMKSNKGANFSKVPILPLSLKGGKFIFVLLKLFNSIIINLLITINKPDIIWITHPKLFKIIKKKHLNKFIIYDCMDDILEFDNNYKDYLQTIEKQTVLQSDLVFCSSISLMNKIIERYKADRSKIHLLRNGINSIKYLGSDSKNNGNNKINLCYFGTIENWFDYEKLDKILSSFPNVHLHLIGPYKSKRSFKSQNFTYYGPLSHDKLMQIVSDFDCFIMPFKLNRLIESVDPVKLYEYLLTGKPVVSVYYDEIKRFENYIYFYNSYQELYSIIYELVNENLKPKKDMEEVTEFLKKNTWKERTKRAVSIIEESIILRRREKAND